MNAKIKTIVALSVYFIMSFPLFWAAKAGASTWELAIFDTTLLIGLSIWSAR